MPAGPRAGAGRGRSQPTEAWAWPLTRFGQSEMNGFAQSLSGPFGWVLTWLRGVPCHVLQNKHAPGSPAGFQQEPSVEFTWMVTVA